MMVFPKKNNDLVYLSYKDVKSDIRYHGSICEEVLSFITQTSILVGAVFICLYIVDSCRQEGEPLFENRLFEIKLQDDFPGFSFDRIKAQLSKIILY